MELKPVAIGDIIDDVFVGIYAELPSNHIKIINKLAKSYENRYEKNEELQFLSDIKNKLASSWISLYFSEKNGDTEQDYTGLKEKIEEALDVFHEYEPSFKWLNYLVKTLFLLYRGLEEPDESLFYDSGEDDWLTDIVDMGAIEFIQIDFIELFREWEYLDGPRSLHDALMVEDFLEDDFDAVISELEWWQDDRNWSYVKENSDYEELVFVFRVIRNNLIKAIRKGELILGSIEWMEKIEIL